MSGERRYRRCAEAFGIEGSYAPACCRFPKSCSPYPYQEAIDAGNVTEDDLEPPAAPRPEPDGQQQAAAEELLVRVRVNRPGEPERWVVGAINVADPGIARLRAEATRPGQELRERARDLLDVLDRINVGYVPQALRDAMAELRAALEDPR